MIIRTFIFLLLFTLSCESIVQSTLNIISDTEFLEIQETDYVLVDVRTVDEFESGHIKNALNLDFYSESFKSNILTLDKGSSIILYCRTQNRSTKAANFLIENGYKVITVIEGGITSWVKNGNDLVYNFSE